MGGKTIQRGTEIMFRLSERSLKILSECDKDLQKIVFELLKTYDITVVHNGGHRNKTLQDNLFKMGASKVEFPNSKHNKKPSQAMDIAPFPLDWGNRTDAAKHNQIAIRRFYYMAGKVDEIARNFGISVRWGGDWDQDNDFFDQRFNDLVHFELI